MPGYPKGSPFILDGLMASSPHMPVAAQLNGMSAFQNSLAPPPVGIKDLTSLQRQILVEKHLISPQLAKKERDGSMLLSDDESTSIMVNEEDHLRIQCMTASFQLQRAYEQANKIDRALEKALPYALVKAVCLLSGTWFYVVSFLIRHLIDHLRLTCMTSKSKWPESRYPGRFDMWGSHAIWHSLVVIAALFQSTGYLKAFHYAQAEISCPAR